MTEPTAPQVRTQFAKRLKALRAQRGFPRARYFASSLGIEENRYTRYERAEVEPSLTLIHKMCETLHVTPNELLGFEAARQREATGFSESETAPRAAASEAKATDSLRALAWSLASEVVGLRQAGRKPADPLATMKETSALFRDLLNKPFETVAELAEDAAIGKANAKRKAEIASLMSRLAAEAGAGGR